MLSQKVALVDADMVAVNLFVATMQRSQLVGINSVFVSDKMITSWDMFDSMTHDECRCVKKLYDDPKFWLHLPAVSGVHTGIECLRNSGYHIQWVTSPWHTCKNWEGIRRIWLAEQGLVNNMINDVTITTEKYMIDGDILIDDRPKHVQLWQAAHPEGKAYLFDTMFNRFFNWPRRITWKDVINGKI